MCFCLFIFSTLRETKILALSLYLVIIECTDWHRLNGVTNEHNSETILSRNDSPSDCLHMTLAYKHHFVWRSQNASPCIDSKVTFNDEWIASRVRDHFRTRASESQIHFPPPTVMPNVFNNLAITRPSKTDWHQMNHPLNTTAWTYFHTQAHSWSYLYCCAMYFESICFSI